MLQLAMVLRGLSSRLEAGKLQIGTLRADDSHRVKPRCVPGDFLSWFVPTKVFTPVLTCRVSVKNCKFNIEGALQYVWTPHHSAVNLAVGQERKATSVEVTSHFFNFIGPLPTDKKIQAFLRFKKNFQFSEQKGFQNVDNSQRTNSCILCMSLVIL